MTTLTMRFVKGDFIVTGPDVEPMKFKSRREVRDWCKAHHPGSPITEVGPGGKRAASRKAPPRFAPIAHGIANQATTVMIRARAAITMIAQSVTQITARFSNCVRRPCRVGRWPRGR
jgi:hypothetical protein